MVILEGFEPSALGLIGGRSNKCYVVKNIQKSLKFVGDSVGD